MKFLYKVRIYPFKDCFNLIFTPLNNLQHKVSPKTKVFRGDADALAKYLMKIKAVDNKKDPPSKYRNKTYQQMVNDAVSGIDNVVYVWSNKSPDNQGTLIDSFLRSDKSAKMYLNELSNNDKKDIIDIKHDILDIDMELIDTTDSEEKENLGKEKADLQQQITDIQSRDGGE